MRAAIAVVGLLTTVSLAATPCAPVTASAPHVFEAALPLKIFSADIDDGFADVVTLGDFGNPITINYGRGDGTMEEPLTLLPNATAAVLTDVNRDGRIDLVAQLSDSMEIVVRTNLGSREFAPPVVIHRGAGRLAVSGDFTNDGVDDLVLGGHSQPLVVLVNDGNGTFLPRQGAQQGVDDKQVAVGDVDGDGNLDIAAASPRLDSLNLLRGNGAGQFTLVPLESGYAILTVGDFDGDARADVLSMNRSTSTTSVYADRTGTLTRRTVRTVTPGVAGAGADFNGDGFNDLAVLEDRSGVEAAVVYVNDGRGDFTEMSRTLLASRSARIGAADMNGDGAIDLIVPASRHPNYSAILLGRGDGTFRSAPSHPAPLSYVRGAEDFDGDGIDELITSYGDRIYVGRLNASRGYTFEEIRLPRWIYPRTATGDVHPAAGKELLVAIDRELHVFGRDASGQWSAIAAHVAPATILGLATGWFDGEPGDEIALVTSDHRLTLLSLARGTEFETAIARTGGAMMESADFDGDGRTDLVLVSIGTYSGGMHDYYPQKDGYVSLFRGRGNGTLGAEERAFGARAMLRALGGDFNGDGWRDLALTTYGGEGVQLLNDGRGGFSVSTFATSATTLAVIDVNGDGFDDVLSGTPAARIFYGTPAGLVAGGAVLFGERQQHLAIRRSRSGPPSLITVTPTGLQVLDATCPSSRRRATRH